MLTWVRDWHAVAMQAFSFQHIRLETNHECRELRTNYRRPHVPTALEPSAEIVRSGLVAARRFGRQPGANRFQAGGRRRPFAGFGRQPMTERAKKLVGKYAAFATVGVIFWLIFAATIGQ